MRKTVGEAMSRNPSVVMESATALEAARIMREEDVGSIPIMKNSRLVGIVTDRDIAVRLVAEGKDPMTAVAEIASENPTWVDEDQPLDEAIEIMAARQIRRLPVLDRNEFLVGMLAQADIAHEAKEKTTGELVEEISLPR